MSKWTALLLACIMIMPMFSNAYASDSIPPTEHISDDLSYAYCQWYNPIKAAGFSITFADAGISPVSNGVYVSGTTIASQEVTSVGGIANIQRWENGAWKTYTQFSFQALQASMCELSQTVSVPGGYYYRLKITHTAEDYIDIVMYVSITDAVYVN